MGFCPTVEKAQALIDVFGVGSQFESQEGTFPFDVERAARDYERTLKVVTLRAVANEETTLEISPEELETLKSALIAEELADTMPSDPWAENTQIRSLVSESGFFVPAAQAG